MVFDAYIKKVADYVDSLAEQGRTVKRLTVPSSVSGLRKGLKVNLGPGANPNIILRSDTFLELGSPEIGSSAFMLFTEDNSIVNDGRITVIGPDIPESGGKSLPFGQIIILGGKNLNAKNHDSLIHAGFIGDMIEGYMVRSLSGNVWSRVGKSAAAKGFDFETLGRALMIIYKEAQPSVESMEIVFFTKNVSDVKNLDEIAVQIHKISKEIVKENWKVKGVDIDCELDCSSCGDKPVCDEIREVLKIKNIKGER
jgi:CO dehydrogenase/acetyl-CoA synthase beta subunit